MNDDFTDFLNDIGCNVRSIITADDSLADLQNINDDLLQETLNLVNNELIINNIVLEEGLVIELDPEKIDLIKWD